MLIHEVSGGVGADEVQRSHRAEAHVLDTAIARSASFMRDLRADHSIDSAASCSEPADAESGEGEGEGERTVMDEAERNARLEAYTRQARDSVCRIAEDGRTEVGLEVEHDGRWFRTIDHIPGEDISDEAIEPVVARRARQIAQQMVARDEARRQRKSSGR